jgi:ankyrin repeat protein
MKKQRQKQETTNANSLKLSLTDQLFKAIEEGDIQKINEIHKQDKSLLSCAVNHNGYSTLMVLCSMADHIKAKTIIEAMFVSKAGNLKNEAMQIKRQEFINKQGPKGETALMILANQKTFSEDISSIAKLLLSNGAKVDLQDESGNNVAHHAAYRGHSFLMQLSVKDCTKIEDSCLFIKNNGGLSSMDILKDRYHEAFRFFVQSNKLKDIVDDHESVVLVPQNLGDQHGGALPLPPINDIIDQGRALREPERIQFILSNRERITELSILFSEWSDADISESDIEDIIMKMKKISSDDQYLVSWAVGYKATITFEHFKSAIAQHLKEQQKHSDNALGMEEAVQALNLEIENLKTQDAPKRVEFIKKHQTENELLVKCFHDWYGVENKPEEVSKILSDVANIAISKMSWSSWALGYQPEFCEQDLQGVLGNYDKSLE